MAQLYFYYGTMNSSKSAQLLMANHNYRDQGKNTIVFKPKRDTRDGPYVTSRAFEEQLPVIWIGEDEQGRMCATTREQMAERDIHCVLVDEAQFLTPAQVDELTDIVDELQVPVLCYGLITDFQTHFFAGSRRLMEIADKRSEIKTVCYYCTSKSLINMRIDEQGQAVTAGEQVKIGGNDTYRPVCRKCYKQRTTRSTRKQQ
ncbi:thymidine kinase [Marinicrinis sediminis]|uniref:Thymidine kinase n=1 Tax=Marinicrinis sediminis TaxID=1652465 RepID=A0ABW5R9H0_9BACL